MYLVIYSGWGCVPTVIMQMDKSDLIKCSAGEHWETIIYLFFASFKPKQ